MAKNGVIIPICFMIVSGCSTFSSTEMTADAPPVSVPVVKDEAPQPAVADVTPSASKEATVASGQSVSADDIRRLQQRLRDLGFNPGLVDGVAGARTKAAFARLEAGCAKLEPLSENLPVSVVHEFSNADKIPSREDTIILQSQLRSAGFDPGPIDGIPGARTKGLIAILHSSCSMVQEFHGTLDQPVRAANSDPSHNAAAKVARSPAPAFPRYENLKAAGSGQAVPQDEIRILQLRLRDAGFDPGPFDGIMGAKTKAALAQYEASQRHRKTKTSLTTNISGQY